MIIDNIQNFMIVEPETLVSVSLLSDSFSCLRRSILQEKVKNSGSKRRSLVLGSLVHKLYQSCLKRRNFALDFINSEARRIVGEAAVDLLDADLDENSVLLEMEEYIPNLEKWASILNSSPSAPSTVDKDMVPIKDVLNIEDHFSSSTLGLKGNVDATVVIWDNQEKRDFIVPLELKTGKATNAISHHAQTILYGQLVAERHGILAYLKSNEMKLLRPNPAELRGLLIQRNKLARALRATPQKYPPVINNAYVCNSCSARDTCALYTKAFGVGDGLDDMAAAAAGPYSMDHLKESEERFFRDWISILDEEDRMGWHRERQSISRSSLLPDNMYLHLKLSSAYSSQLELLDVQEEPESEEYRRYRFNCVFQQVSKDVGRSQRAFAALVLEGESVVLSNPDRSGIVARGIVASSDDRSIRITTDRVLASGCNV
ncbi:Tripartite DNA replication factor [Phlyctochytrium bullatum]|nr:Tripartite DNA replication factor [Phlyctochytrium bullatum]